jgi:hypothetical protein
MSVILMLNYSSQYFRDVCFSTSLKHKIFYIPHTLTFISSSFALRVNLQVSCDSLNKQRSFF